MNKNIWKKRKKNKRTIGDLSKEAWLRENQNSFGVGANSNYKELF